MAFEDKVLVCRDCGGEFVFSAGEQEFYAEKGFENEPSRCPSCRASRRQHFGADRPQRELYPAICSNCGVETKVPFRPSGDKPVYCRECFQKMKGM